MIRPSPDTLPGRALAAIVADPGAHTAESLAALLLPYRPPPQPAPSPRWTRLGLAPVWSPSASAEAEAARSAAVSTIARALSRLTEAGYLAPAGDVVALHPASLAAYQRGGVDALLALAARDDPDDDADLDAAPDTDADAARPRILLALLAGPVRYRDLLGARPSGGVKLAYRQLSADLVIATPSHRRPTPAGVALASEWASEKTRPAPCASPPAR